MLSNFYRSTYRFYRFKFPFSASEIALTSSLMIVAHIHPTSVYWIISFEGNAGVLSQAATQAKTVPEFKKMHFS